jgi:hypothetical protein
VKRNVVMPSEWRRRKKAALIACLPLKRAAVEPLPQLKPTGDVARAEPAVVRAKIVVDFFVVVKPDFRHTVEIAAEQERCGE